jgi:flagellar basal body rod protein FlgG
MPYGLYLSADGATVQSKRLEVLANNLANVDTVGFKREMAVFKARESEALAQGLDTPGARGINDISGGVRFFETLTDHSIGPFDHTGNNTDLAIAGEGFFQIERDGQKFLTRAGNFSFDNLGQLLTQQGDRVLDSTGTPIVIDPEGGPVEIGSDGTVFQFDGGVRDPITEVAIVRPASLGDLVKHGENLFRPLADVAIVPPDARRIRPGFIERSTTRATEEMMALIETTRMLEANVNLIRNQDQVIGSLVNRALRE